MRKKTIVVVGLDPRAAAFYAGQIEELFGEYAEVRCFSVKDGSATRQLPEADLFVISTDAYGSAEEVARHVPIDSETMGIEVSYRWSTLEELWSIPEGTKALFVNMTETMSREAISQLASLGVNHIHFIPFYPGAELKEPVELAVTPDEERYVPAGIKRVINIGQRPCTSGMMIEVAIRLGLEQLLETEPFQAYLQSIATSNYSFDQMYARSCRLESQFHILMEILGDGLVGVNEKGEIFACNRQACQIARVEEKLVMGRRGEEVFPYIPFYSAMKDKQEIPAKMTKLYGINVGISVIPVLRQKECIGAFAVLQRYNDLESRQTSLRNQLLQKGHMAKYTIDDVLGESACIRRTREILLKMAATESPVLLVGETGTGKELLAHAVHCASRRAKGPFIAINVAAMPENLLESELFGYEEGAFTGAKKGGRPGLFEFAHEGTLFLDEVEGMSPSMQVKLLRVLQEGEVMRVGGGRIVRVDVRIVAATNESLEQKVEEGSFRRDLYYRLNALTILVPPLRERDGDILILLDHFRRQVGGEFDISQEVRDFLLRYPWPGNIRELRNAVEYFNYTGSRVIGMADLPPTMMGRLAGKSGAGTANGTGKLPESYGDSVPDVPHISADGDLFWFLLGELYQAEEKRELIGREKLLEMARSRHLPVSQREVRLALAELSARGLVKVGRGRGGSRITPAGRAQWEQYAAGAAGIPEG